MLNYRHINQNDNQSENVLDELGIIPIDEEDREQLEYILHKLLAYPSKSIAQLHRDCNKLGELDRNEDHEDRLTISDLVKLGADIKYCPCCGFIKQESDIKLCHRVEDVINIGLSTFLYFRTLVVLIVLLIIMFLVYGIFATATNLVASNAYQTSEDVDYTLLSSQGVLSVSLGSKQINETQQNFTLYAIQAWFGVLMIILWIVYLITEKARQKKAEIRVREQSYSAADFSIIMENVPRHISQEQIQREFTKYAQENGFSSEAPLIIAKFNEGRPFYLNEDYLTNQHIEKLNVEHRQKIKQLSSWIQKRKKQKHFSASREEREKCYSELLELKKNRIYAYQSMSQKIIKQFEEAGESPTYTAFVTFETNKDREMFMLLNRNGFVEKIRSVLWCCSNESRFNLTDDTGNVAEIKICQAPEPEDIIWTNLGRSNGERMKRKLITYAATVVLLAASFGVVYGLSVWQTKNSRNKSLSLFISLVLIGFNFLIQFIIRELTRYERQYTSTNHQATLGFKSVFALLINSILIPILVNVLVEGNYYGNNGLAYDIFFLGISNALVSPIFKILDIYYFFTRIKAWYKNRPFERLGNSQQELNAENEYLFFEVGYEYIYAVNLFLFTCFFVSLQPIIVLFSIVGLGLMHWSQKHSIYSRCKRPVPGGTTINNAMYQLISLGGVFYSAGSFSWSSFSPHGVLDHGFIPNLISLWLSIIMFLMPYDLIFSYVHKDRRDEAKRQFVDCRIYLPTEYDRLNPATSVQAIQQFQQFLQQFKRRMAKRIDNQLMAQRFRGQENGEHRGDDSQMKKMQQIFMRQMGRGRQTNPVIPSFNLFQSDSSGDNYNAIQQIFSRDAHIINPLILGASVLENKHNKKMGLWSKVLGTSKQDTFMEQDTFMAHNAPKMRNEATMKKTRFSQTHNQEDIGSLNPYSSSIFKNQNQFTQMFNPSSAARQKPGNHQYYKHY